MSRPDTKSRMLRWRVPVLIALGAWLVIELLFIGQAMHVDAFDFWQAIKVTVPRTVMWLFFAPLAVVLGFWFIIQLFNGVASLGVDTASGGVAFFAHIGGFVAGLVVVFVYLMFNRPPERVTYID